MGSAPYESVGGRSRKPKIPAELPASAQANQDSKAKAAPMKASTPRKDPAEGKNAIERGHESPMRTLEA